MARTHYVKSARKDQGSCRSPDCREESRTILKGTAYKWFSIRSHKADRGQRRVYHTGCRVPPSHTTTSAQLGMIYDAIDTAERLLGQLSYDTGSIDDLQSIAQGAAEGVRDAGEMYRESAENIESGFGHSTYVSDELNEKADNLDSWADDLESLDFNEFELDADDVEEGEEPEDAEARQQEEWWQEQTDKLDAALQENPL